MTIETALDRVKLADIVFEDETCELAGRDVREITWIAWTLAYAVMPRRTDENTATGWSIGEW